MKKLISLVLVLALCLTAVSAFAETFSPDTISKFLLSGDQAETTTPGVTIKPVSDESKTLVNGLVEGGNLLEDVYKKTTFVGDAVNVEEGEWTNIAIIPMPAIEIDEQVEAEFVEIKTPIPAAIAEYILSNIDNIIALFTYKADDNLFTSKVAFEIVKAEDLTYSIIYKIPAEVLKAAQGCPSFMDIEFVK